jgi:hypothetical protein
MYLLPIQPIVISDILPLVGDTFCPEGIRSIGFNAWDNTLEMMETLLHVAPPVHE